MNTPNLSAEQTLSATQNIKEGEYWTRTFSQEFVKPVFPFDVQHNNQREYKEANIQLPDDVVSRLLKISSGSDTRLHMLLVAVVALLLDRYSTVDVESSTDMIIGTTVYRQEVEGNFINTILPLRIPINWESSFKQLLISLRQIIKDAVEHQNYPMATLMYRLDIPYEEDDEFPLFDTTVLLENIHSKEYLASIHINTLFLFHRMDDKIIATLRYNAQRYSTQYIAGLSTHLIYLLQQVLFNVDQPLDTFDILTDEERHTLLDTFNDTGLDYDRSKTISALFEEQVEQRPDQVAVFPDLTYSQLNSKANRLARLLREKGAGEGKLVAMIMDRNQEMMVAILAIIKAGGAYLPIAPDTPIERIHQILEDANVSQLITGSGIVDRFSFTGLQNLRITRRLPFCTASRQPMQNLDQLAMPDRSYVDYDKYADRISLAMVKHCITMQGTRGCPYSCAYCARLWPKKQVVRSATHLFDEVRHYYDMGVRRFALIDDIFNLDVQNSRRYFQKIIDHKMDIQLLFPAGLRGDIMTEDYIDLMVAAGTVNISVALETASPRLQKLIRKNLDIEKLRHNLNYICQTHPHVIVDLFTMHGLPTETEEEAMMTLDFIKTLQWLHFPLINITRIYPNTLMEELALQSGISRESILKNENLPWHEASDTLPFDKQFTTRYQTDFLENYFLKKERLLQVLPYQMKILTEDELVQKYASYLDADNEIQTLTQLLEFLGIQPQELGDARCVPESRFKVPNLSEKINRSFQVKQPDPNALPVLLLDLSLSYSHERRQLDSLHEPPLGLMYLMTSLSETYGTQVNGKIAKSGIDFDSPSQLKELLQSFKPQVIGIRTLTFYKDFFHRTAAQIRQWGYEGALVTGGPYATNGYTALLQDPNIDAVVLAEGEITFNELIGAIIDNNGKLPSYDVMETIPGLVLPRRQRTDRTAIDILMMDCLEDRLATYDSDNLKPVNQPEDPVYSIFTSGSTGIPKGVLVSHRNLHNLVIGLNERIYKHSEKPLQVAMVSPYIFDASVKQLFGALLLGHTLHIIPEEMRVDGYALIEYLKESRVNVCDGTPTHLKLLVESSDGRIDSTDLNFFLIGGETLDKGTALAFFDSFEDKPPRIYNVYGPTECTVDATALEITEKSLTGMSRITIGTPMPNHQILIVANDRLQPVGVPGELCIAGDGVALGYLNRPQLTAGKFALQKLNHREHQEHGVLIGEGNKNKKTSVSSVSSVVQIYKTGDLARWQQDGTIQFLGRLDRQVKIRGYRMELGEIEAQLMGHPDIKQAIVLVKTDDSGSPFLCAYFVPQHKDSFKDTSSQKVLRDYLSMTLPDYMLPPYYLEMEAIPLTANGKIDRRALPEPGLQEIGETHTPAETPFQVRLVEIWADVLSIDKEKIGIDSNFFEIGGHSLKATILIAKIHKAFNVKIPLITIFDSPTVRALAQYIQEAEAANFSGLVFAEEKEYYPLSYNQKRLWFINRMEPHNTAFTMAGNLKIQHDVEPVVIRNVLDSMMKRHECFRTGFRLVDGEPMQFILPELVLPLETIDITHMEDSEKESEVSRLFSQKVRTTFDLTEPPLFRSILIKVSPSYNRFIFCMHHIVSDGWSMEILRSEFQRLYNAYREDDTVQLEPVTFQYKDFALWHNRQVSDPSVGESAIRYWKERIDGGIPLCDISGDYRCDPDNRAGAAWEYKLDLQLKNDIKALAEKTNTSPFGVLFSIYLILLSRFSGQEDVACSIINSGRNHVDLHHITGFFVNAVMFYTDVPEDIDFQQFLKRVTDETTEAFQHQHYPLELVLEQLNKQYPQLPGTFNLLNMQDQTLLEEMESFEPVHIDDYQDVKFDFESYLVEYKNGITILWTYKKGKYEPTTMKRIIDEYIKMLRYFTSNPRSSYKDFRQTFSKKKKSLW